MKHTINYIFYFLFYSLCVLNRVKGLFAETMPAKFSCGWRDGSAKKLNIQIGKDSDEWTNDGTFSVFLATGVECGQEARPEPAGHTIVCEVSGLLKYKK